MKRLLLPLVILILLGGVAGWFWWQSSAGQTTFDSDAFAVNDTAAVTKLFLADKQGNQILLERQDYGWTLNGQHPARPDAVKLLLKTLNRARIKMPVAKSARKKVIENLASNSVKVEVYTEDPDEPLKVIYVGGPNKEHTGTNMLLENTERPFVVHVPGFVGYLTPRFFTNQNEWRSRDLFKYAPGTIRSVTVEHPQKPEESFKVVDNGDNTLSLFSLATGGEIADFDTLAVMQLVKQFEYVPFEGFEETAWAQKRDSVTSSPPQQRYTVENITGTTRTITTWLKPMEANAEDSQGNPILFDLDRMVCVTADDEYVVVQYHKFDPLAKKLSDLSRAKPVEN